MSPGLTFCVLGLVAKYGEMKPRSNLGRGRRRRRGRGRGKFTVTLTAEQPDPNPNPNPNPNPPNPGPNPPSPSPNQKRERPSRVAPGFWRCSRMRPGSSDLVRATARARGKG